MTAPARQNIRLDNQINKKILLSILSEYYLILLAGILKSHITLIV